MPSLLHEAPLLLIEQQPQLLLDLLTDSLHLQLPPFHDVTVSSADHNEVVVVEGRSDKVLVLSGPAPALAEGRQPVLGIIAESQLSCDEDKLYSWPFYHAALRRKLRCEAWLVVVTPEEAVARWARHPVPRYQPGSQFVPLVLGPEEIPQVTSEETARAHPALAVLSALVHGNRPGATQVVVNGLRAADLLAAADGPSYHSLILSVLDTASAALLKEMLMLNEDRLADMVAESYLGKKAVVRAEARAEARAVLTFLSARGITVAPEIKQQILSCADLATLDRWIRRAATCATAEDVVAAP